MAKETPEGRVKSTIKDTLNSLRIWDKRTCLSLIRKDPSLVRGYYRMPVPSAMSETGISDFVVYCGPYIVEIEAKSLGGNLSMNQTLHKRVLDTIGTPHLEVKGEKQAGLWLRMELINRFRIEK